MGKVRVIFITGTFRISIIQTKMIHSQINHIKEGKDVFEYNVYGNKNMKIGDFTGLIFHCPNYDEVFHLHIASVRVKKK